MLGTSERGLAQTVALTKGNFSAANTLGSINLIAGASLSTLGVIALAAAAIVVGISALQTALKPIMIILGSIGKVLGAALLPISMVIVTLLQPLIYLLMPFIKLMNLIFRPIRQFLMQQIAGAKKEYAANPLGFIMKAMAGLMLGPVAIPFFTPPVLIRPQHRGEER